MKQKLLNSLRLRACLLVAVLCGAFSNAWGESIEINTTNFAKTSSSSGYAAYDGTRTISDVDITSSNVMVQSGKLQFKKSSGYLYNLTAMPGNITKITLATATNFTIYVGTSANSETQTVTSGSTITGNYTYFKVKCGSSTGTTATITVEYASGGTPSPSLSVSPSSIAFGDQEIGDSYQETFDVTFANLTQDLTVSGFAGVTVSPASISKNATSPQTVTVTYAPTAVGSINGNITVSNTDDAVSETVTVTGSAYDPANVTYYEKVTSAPDNWSGDYIFTGINSSNYYALTGVSSNLGTTAVVSVTQDGIQSTSTTDTYKVTIAETTNGYSLYMDGVGYLSYSGSSNQLHASDDFAASTCEWTISFADGVATITNVGTTSRILQFNYNSGNPRFACYGNSNQTKLTLFKYDDGTPSISADDINISYNVEDGEITYTINNSVSGGSLVASETSDWLEVDDNAQSSLSGTIEFVCDANSATTARTATVTLTYTYNTSETVTKTVTVTQAADPNAVMTIAEARAQATGSVTTKGVVTSCSGTTAYIQDETAAICVYGEALTVGNEVKVSGSLTDYNGLLEITSPTVTTLSQNNNVSPEVMTIAQVSASSNQGWLVKIEDATVTAISGQNVTIAQSENTITMRVNDTNDITFDVYDVITLTGNIGHYNSNNQIANPTDITITGSVTPTYTVSWTAGANTELTVFDAADEGTPLTTGVAVTAGTFIRVSVGVDQGYELSALTVKDASNQELTLTEIDPNVYYEFEMPSSNVTITSSATASATPVSGKYVKVTSTDGITDGQYLIVYEEGKVAFDGSLGTLDAVNNVIDVTINNDEITATSATQAAEFTINVSAGTIQSASGYYIGATSYNNELKTSAENPYTNSISIDNSNAVIVVAINENNSVTLKYNKASNQNRFRYYKSGQEDIQLYKFVAATPATESITVGAAGYTTYVTQNNVSFPSSVKAYIVTAINNNSIHLEEVLDAPADAALVIKAAAGTYELEFDYAGLYDDQVAATPNLLQASDGSVTGDGTTIWALAMFNNKVGFNVVGNGVTIPAGKAYLVIPSEIKGFLTFDFDSEDAIKGVEAISENGVIFNLAGQRVSKAQKGIYIVNGKKVLVK